MTERRVVSQSQRVLPGDIECLPHQREHLGLFDRVDAQVSLEIQVQLQHVAGIARLLCHQSQHLLRHDTCRGR